MVMISSTDLVDQVRLDADQLDAGRCKGGLPLPTLYEGDLATTGGQEDEQRAHTGRQRQSAHRP